jgi:hypothetical protein
MSLYMQAVQSGMSAAQLALTGDNAETKAAYNASYAATQQRLNMANAKVNAESQIAGAKQDKVLAVTDIKMKQAHAEANAKVAAAVAGVEGGSVDDVVYETEKNEAHRIADANKREDQEIESLLGKVYSAQSGLLHVNEPEISYAGELLQAFSSFELEDFQRSETLSTMFSGGA